MKFLANENFPTESVKYLQKKGVDLKSVGLEAPSISDEEVMELATKEDRCIITFDSDYGELIFRKGFRPPAGVIYLRFGQHNPTFMGHYLDTFLKTHQLQLRKTLTVIDKNSVRQRGY